MLKSDNENPLRAVQAKLPGARHAEPPDQSANPPTPQLDHSRRQLITIDDLAALLRIPKATLYNWVSQGRVPHIKLGRSLRFDLAHIEQYLQRATILAAGKR